MAAARDIGRGDADVVAGATHELYNRYGRQIYAYCLHHLSSREEAEDAVQTTFMNAFRGLQRGTICHAEQAWLFKIAHNVCLSRQTSSWRRRRVEAPNDFEILQEIIPSPPRSGAEELIGLEDALEAMPENQRRAILLREWQGLSYREISEELELSQSAVEMLIFRARRALASALEPSEPPQTVGPRLNLGALLAGLKSALTGGAAAKVVAVTVAASTVGVAVQPVERTIVDRGARRAAPLAVTAVAAVAYAAPALRAVASEARMRVPMQPVAARARVRDSVAPVAVAGGGSARPSFDTAGVEPPLQQASPVPASAPAPAAPAAPVQEQSVSAAATAPNAPPPSVPATGGAKREPPKNDPPQAQPPSAPATTPSKDAPKQSQDAPKQSQGNGNGQQHNGRSNGNDQNDTGKQGERQVATSAPQQPAEAAAPVTPAQAAPAASHGNGNGDNGKKDAETTSAGNDSDNGNGKGKRDNGKGNSGAPVAPLLPPALPIQPAPTSSGPTPTPAPPSSATPPPAPPAPAPAGNAPPATAPPLASDAHDNHDNHDNHGNGKGKGH